MRGSLGQATPASGADDGADAPAPDPIGERGEIGAETRRVVPAGRVSGAGIDEEL